MGHKEDFNNWWDNAYAKASSNVLIDTDNLEVKIKAIAAGDDDKAKRLKKKYQDSYKVAYQNFLQSHKLENGVTVKTGRVEKKPKETKAQINRISDDELFRVCGGRTAHKGARHGLTQSGKLARIERQELELMAKLQGMQLQPSTSTATASEKCKTKLVKGLVVEESSKVKVEPPSEESVLYLLREEKSKSRKSTKLENLRSEISGSSRKKHKRKHHKSKDSNQDEIDEGCQLEDVPEEEYAKDARELADSYNHRIKVKKMKKSRKKERKKMLDLLKNLSLDTVKNESDAEKKEKTKRIKTVLSV